MQRHKRLRTLLTLALTLAMVLTLLNWGLPAAGAAAGDFQIVGLKTNNMANPIGIDTVTAPRFSWRMESDVIGQCQTAYRIEVAADSAFTQSVWDTGKAPGGLSVGIAYAGAALTESTVYYWRVTVWDKDDVPATSDPATF